MEVYNSNKGSVASKAVVSYMDRVRQNMSPKAKAAGDFLQSDKRDVQELVGKLSAADRKKLPPNFLDDVSSFNDLKFKAVTANLDPVVSKKIRAIAADIEAKNTATMARISRRRGIAAATGAAAEQREMMSQLAQKQPFGDRAVEMARLVKQIMRRQIELQKSPIVSLETGAATITPETPTKVT